MKKKLLIGGAILATLLTVGTVVYAVQPKETPRASVAQTTEKPVEEPAPTPEPVVETPPPAPTPSPVQRAVALAPVKDLRTVAREQYINADSRARLSTMEGWSSVQEPYFWQCFEDAVTRLSAADPTFKGWESEATINKIIVASTSFSVPCDSRDRTRILTRAMALYCQPSVQPLSCNWE